MKWEIINGDCLEEMKKMPDASVDAVVTDPPYCSGGRQQSTARSIISKGGEARKDTEWFGGDNMGTDTYIWFMREIAKQSVKLCKQGAPAYIFTDWRQINTIVTAWESAGWTYKSMIVWDKNRGGAMGSWWRNNHELIAAFVKGKANPLSSHSYFNTWTGSKKQGGVHPTEKPVDLMRYIVSSITPKSGLVLDPFMGSGSTGVAAVLEGYDFIGIEQSPEYCDIARSRIAEAERQMAQKLS